MYVPEDTEWCYTNPEYGEVIKTRIIRQRVKWLLF